MKADNIRTIPYRFYGVGLTLAIMILFSTVISYNVNSITKIEDSNFDNERLELIKEYADRVLHHGADRWSGKNTPLLADGINIDTGEPVVWRYQGEEFLISNMASQQNLFRLLTGLTNLTGNEHYKEAAKESIKYHFDNLVSESGLLRWGGHQFIDLKTLEPVGHFDADLHEFKNTFPFYELMWETDEEATERFIKSYWNAHMFDWETLDMNRHGQWDLEEGHQWQNEFSDPEPFFEGDGLTFINAGSDLIYAAGLLYRFNGEQGALDWANRLHGMYLKARHPETGLGVYQYSKPRASREPIQPMYELRHTSQRYGDRAQNQFGLKFGDVAKEGWVLWGTRVKSIYVNNGFMQLGMAEAMGDDGTEFLQGTADGLRALTNYAYKPENNHFVAMWADGTELTNRTVPQYGYYCQRILTNEINCSAENMWSPLEADMEFLMTYARAYRLTGDPIFWETARNMALGLGLGEIGKRPGEGVTLNMNADGSDYEEIFALLELYRAAEHPDYLNRAKVVADRIIKKHFHNGFFLPSEDHIHANFDSLEPLAILTLEAVLRGTPEKVPSHVGGAGYIHGRFDDMGRTNDSRAIWPVKRE